MERERSIRVWVGAVCEDVPLSRGKIYPGIEARVGPPPEGKCNHRQMRTQTQTQLNLLTTTGRTPFIHSFIHSFIGCHRRYLGVGRQLIIIITIITVITIIIHNRHNLSIHSSIHPSIYLSMPPFFCQLGPD